MKSRLRSATRHLMNRMIAGLRKLKLGPRLLSGFLLVALLPTTALCGIAYVGAREQILLGEERSSLRMAQYLRSEVSALLQSYPSKLNTIASDMAVIRLIRNFRKADALEAKSLQYELMSRLISEASGLRGFMSMEIITDEGRPISKLPFSIMNEELFERIRGSEEKFAYWVGQYRWGDLYPEAAISQKDKTVVLAARRIIDYANVKLMGYIVLTLDCTEIERLLPADAGTQLIVSGADGEVLASVGGERAAAARLANELSAMSSEGELQSHTLKIESENHLVISGQLTDSPYRLTLAIPYSHMLNGLGQMFTMIVAAAVCIALIMMGIALLLTRSVTAPVGRLSRAMRKFGAGDFTLRLGDQGTDEIGLLCGEFDDMTSRVRELTEQLREAQSKEKEAVYTALQAQINPHFLYNTLDMISWMGYGASNSDICKVVGSLSDFFRLGLNKGEESFTLGDELNHVKSYIAIQEYRMRNIRFSVEADERLYPLRVPKLMVQPLVENAIQHGLKPRKYRGEIIVRCGREGDLLVISVRDDGVGFDETQMPLRAEQSTGYGIRNIRQRLSILYGEAGKLMLRNNPEGGTTAVIELPIAQEDVELFEGGGDR